MKSLISYINEHQLNENLISDDQLLYVLGVHVLNAMQPDRARNLVQKYKISKSNQRPGVLRYSKDNMIPIISNSEELIPRSQWDFDTLTGETEYQLMHPDYSKASDLILKKMNPEHDILTIFQCSARKPYSENKLFKYNFVKPYHEVTDFACISNPGIIPFEYSAHYPFRYDEWSIPTEEKIKDIVGLTHKYRIVNLCRFLRFQREMKYKHVIAVIPNPLKDWVFKTAIKYNIEGAKDWCHIVLTDQFRDKLAKKYTSLGDLLTSRLLNLPDSFDQYSKILKKCAKDSGRVHELWKERRQELGKNKNESIEKPKYQMMESIGYQDIMKKFKESIKDNMSDPSVDKGSNNLYYKSYYWTALDIMLIGLDGNLVKNIDKDYWDFVEKMNKDKDFEKIDEFIYCYKPLCENDKVTPATCKKEAFKLQILQEPHTLDLNDNLFKK